jgi:uncharacterized protein (TIGR02271 family)
MFFAMQKSYLDVLTQTTRAMAATSAMKRQTTMITEGTEAHEQVVGIGEEVLGIATHRVPGGATRVRRSVSEVPVERAVELHDETITIERRPANGASGADVLTEREFVMIDTREIPVVTKHAQVREELVLRREITGRVELVRETLKRTDVEVMQPQRLPAILATKPDDNSQRQENKRTDDKQHNKQH